MLLLLVQWPAAARSGQRRLLGGGGAALVVHDAEPEADAVELRQPDQPDTPRDGAREARREADRRHRGGDAVQARPQRELILLLRRLGRRCPQPMLWTAEVQLSASAAGAGEARAKGGAAIDGERVLGVPRGHAARAANAASASETRRGGGVSGNFGPGQARRDGAARLSEVAQVSRREIGREVGNRGDRLEQQTVTEHS
mmetsp:Transcript_23839/g.70573  ORF Transcript_23839/g.70573 Transcript_23839/m.70573 type:complete len:200 (-) Transcript_23839:1139-1738(-)